MGGPHVTSSQVERLLNGLRVGMTRSAACAWAGFHRATLYRMLEDATFATEVEKAEGEAKAVYESKIAEAASAGTWQAAAWWLERRHPGEYARKERVDINVDIRTVLERLTDDPAEREAAHEEVRRILAEARQ